MATISFEVHTDKENVSSASVSRKAIKGSSAKPLGSRDQNQFPTQAVRQALKNVNHQVPPAPTQGQGFAKPKSSLAGRSADIENMPIGGLAKKMEAKKTPSVKRDVLGSSQNRMSLKSKPSKIKEKAELEPIQQIYIPDDEEYDSDSILPRSDRLSSYMGKLLTWRPPCLFGSIPDSDPEFSDHDDDLIPDVEIFEVPPTWPVDVPELPAPEDLEPVDFPFLDFGEEQSAPDEFSGLASPEPLSDLSFNVSFPLGTLQMIQSQSGSPVRSPGHEDSLVDADED